jgi:tetratricopeptide (TPR) repeat protein
MALNMLRNDPDTRGVVLSNAANAYAEQGDIDSADAFFNEAINLAHRTKNTTAETTRRGNYGWFLIATGRPRQAIAALEQALRLSESLELDLQRAVQTDNLGLAYDLMGDFTKALEFHERARALAQPLGNQRWKMIFQVNEANTRLELGQTDAAALLLEEALRQSRADSHIEGIVQALIGTARVYLKRKQPQQAENALSEALALARKADLRRLVAETLSVQSQHQAAVNNPERSLALWEEARKLFGILQNPKANHMPAWLAEASSS